MSDTMRKILFGRKKSDQLNRKELIALMFKIAFLEAMALSLILPSVVSTGEISGFCNIPSCETGTVTVSIPITSTDGSAGAIQTFNFPTAFASNPRTVGVLNTTQFETRNDIPYYFQLSGTATSWPAMPLALTELYGNTQHEIVNQAMNTITPVCGLFVDVVAPGTASAVLRVQYSADQVSWFNAFPNTATSDVSIASAGLQFSSDAFDQLVVHATPFLRVVGLGGNGVVSPSFTNIQFLCQFAQHFVTAFIVSYTKTTFTVSVALGAPLDATAQIQVTWIAYL